MAEILWLTKRQYMSKDLLDDRYGRYFELPRHLATLGHRIHVLALSYRVKPETRLEEQPNLIFESIYVGKLLDYLRRATQVIRDREVAVVIGSSDMHFCILAYALGRRFGIPKLFDIYDNFETYASANLPMHCWLFYRVMRKADGHVIFTESLADYLRQKVPHPRYRVVNNSIDERLFRPLDRARCREQHGLAADDVLIGYFGAISSSRGVDVLFTAASILRHQGLRFKLLLAGTVDKDLALDEAAGVIYLGQVAHADVPGLINACNVNVVCYKDDDFARFSFPVKGVEYMACQVPFVAPAVGGIVDFLSQHPEYLYETGDADDLAQKITALLARPTHRFPAVDSWLESARIYSDCIEEVLTRTARSSS